MDLMVDVYTATETFPRHELYGLTSQLRRAACSVVSNIAEGQGRLTFGEWRQMLSQARGSLYELQAQVIAAHRLGFLSAAAAEHLKKQSRIAGMQLAGLIQWVRKQQANRATRTKSPSTSNQ